MQLSVIPRRLPSLPPMAGWALMGFAFWVSLLLALEAGNVVRAMQVGRTLSIAEEARRIAGAGLLGAALVPVQVALVRRLGAARAGPAVKAGLLAAALPAMALFLLAIADMLAPFVLSPGNPRLGTPFFTQAAVDFPILLGALIVSTAGIHLLGRRGPDAAAVRGTGSSYPQRIPVPVRSGISFVNVAAIEWIESQGNYVALHLGEGTHLVRSTLTEISNRLDPTGFVRIHRRAVLNLAHAVRIDRLASGDAAVTLQSGKQVRVSRTYAPVLRVAFGEQQ